MPQQFVYYSQVMLVLCNCSANFSQLLEGRILRKFKPAAASYWLLFCSHNSTYVIDIYTGKQKFQKLDLQKNSGWHIPLKDIYID